jgi:predicted amidophosphoribosyltransferase
MVIVDDVVTSGATIAEAARVLRRVGVPVGCSATVAAALR